MDNVLQIYSEPTEFSLLNVDKNSYREMPIMSSGEDLLLGFIIDLSNEISIEKRIVTNFPSLFGDIFGLYELMATIAIFIVGSIPAKLHLQDQVKALYRLAKSSNSEQDL